jgi:hypothetical protein
MLADGVVDQCRPRAFVDLLDRGADLRLQADTDRELPAGALDAVERRVTRTPRRLAARSGPPRSRARRSPRRNLAQPKPNQGVSAFFIASETLRT